MSTKSIRITVSMFALLMSAVILKAQSDKIDPAILKSYQEVLHQSVEITKSTHELLTQLNSKKGKQVGGFTSEENKEKGMSLLRTYGDTRLSIEELQTRLAARKGETALGPVVKACERMHQIVDDGRNQLLDAYQFPDDEAGTAKIIAELAENLTKLQDPKGPFAIGKN
ncbi:MAG: hypothetical protein H6606_08970 [Flavobacteriales bacterium]|nr:hypothetical protein [Flavobacteriales bacterium]